MPFPPKSSASLGADPDAAGDLQVSPAVSLGGGKGNPSKKQFGGGRALTAGGGGGSKFGGFRKGGGVMNFKGGEALMARDDDAADDTPTPPSSPKNPFAKGMDSVTKRSTPGLDRPIGNAWQARDTRAGDAMTPRELSDDTKGALTNVKDVDKQFEKDIYSRPYNRRFSRDYGKKPLTLTGGKR